MYLNKMSVKIVRLLVIFIINVMFSTNVYGNPPYDIKVGLFYETLSPDCVDFIHTQLIPTYKELSKYFVIRYVPFGKATQQYNKEDDLWYFTCEHGDAECLYNMIHACSLSIIQNRDGRTGFIDCLATARNVTSLLSGCCDMFSVNEDDINSCVYKGKKGNHLLAEYGNETFYYFPEGLYSVPTITVNTVYNKKNQKLARQDFRKLICKYIQFYYKHKPAACE